MFHQYLGCFLSSNCLERSYVIWVLYEKGLRLRTSAVNSRFPDNSPPDDYPPEDSPSDNSHPDNSQPWQLPPRTIPTRTIANHDNCPPENCHSGEFPTLTIAPQTIPTRTIANPDNCPPGEFPLRTIPNHEINKYITNARESRTKILVVRIFNFAITFFSGELGLLVMLI